MQTESVLKHENNLKISRAISQVCCRCIDLYSFQYRLWCFVSLWGGSASSARARNTCKASCEMNFRVTYGIFLGLGCTPLYFDISFLPAKLKLMVRKFEARTRTALYRLSIITTDCFIVIHLGVT